MTGSPVASRARCACPIDAAASGTGSKEANTARGRRAEFGDEQCLDAGRVHGRDVILEPGQLGDDIGRQQVGPGGQHLAELDEHAAGLVQRGSEVAG